MRETRHYLGLELAGAKNQKTALAALEYYPREKKIFLLDIFDRIAGHHADGTAPDHAKEEAAAIRYSPAASGGSAPLSQSGTFGLTTRGDQALMDLISELIEDTDLKTFRMGVNVPLQLPPCITSGLAAAKPSADVVRAVKWMRDATRKAERAMKGDPGAQRVLEFTTYTQRPIELWVRYQVLPKLPASHRFEIDEALGGNKAPLTARMNFLKRHLGGLSIVEAWPKLTVALLALELGLPKRTVQAYRRLEEGVHAREQFLETLSSRHGIFIYERDVRKLAASLPAFDAFICAYTALLSDTQRCAKPPAGFPKSTGWVQYPQC